MATNVQTVAEPATTSDPLAPATGSSAARADSPPLHVLAARRARGALLRAEFQRRLEEETDDDSDQADPDSHWPGTTPPDVHTASQAQCPPSPSPSR